MESEGKEGNGENGEHLDLQDEAIILIDNTLGS